MYNRDTKKLENGLVDYFETITNANNAPTTKNRRGADYQEQINIGNLKRCRSTE